MNTITLFLAVIIVLTVIFLVYFFSDLFKNDEAKASLKDKKNWVNLSIAGVVTQFFDYMGIGSNFSQRRSALVYFGQYKSMLSLSIRQKKRA